jgi:hypothetical protein
MTSKYLAVLEDGTTYIEDSSAVIARNIAQSSTISYYAIEVDPDTNEPSLSSVVELSSAPRVAVARRERVGLEASGRDVGSAEIEILEE